ncbi:AbrB/MazE/SpoVT family DNA-binding domain-containing protein [Cupriavidus sp. AU9028]|uniref:AbrB/MazE/SpoVT family DNA-binding domain-containing protein n=1 Tax=Cupriavidus sp. AU9028 TaxID=2871157 RepID=UPI001C94B711|nr:AbrB/MazE/SpoVT family DNA-binding domain-containing protein [Cupriavidus sp. AU9028]MBY4897802.1 AbrB/MazE/SpoVT family DNA-binding domain-containing protein [Cupriavidus sp. AU9028]
MRVRVEKWGDSLAVRLPEDVVAAFGLKEGDDVDVRMDGSGGLVVSRASGASGCVARLRRYRGRLPAHYKFDRRELE